MTIEQGILMNSARKRSWKTRAKRLLGKKAVQNIGDGSSGQFALVTPCRDQIDFCLWASRDAAENLKSWLDLVGCCGGCWPKRHYIIDLGAMENIQPPPSSGVQLST